MPIPLNAESRRIVARATALQAAEDESLRVVHVLSELLNPQSSTGRLVGRLGLDAARIGAIVLELAKRPWANEDYPTWHQVLERARHEATKRGAKRVAPKHLLIALMEHPNGLPSGLLQSLGLTQEMVLSERPSRVSHRLAAEDGEAIMWVGDDHSRGEQEEFKTEPSEDNIDESSLVEVVPIGMSVQKSGVTVELIALEIRTLGAILHWKASTRRPAVLGAATLLITDDKGTRYSATTLRQSGSDRLTRGELGIFPAPARAKQLRIEFQEFVGVRAPLSLQTGGKSVRGPWDFEVGL